MQTAGIITALHKPNAADATRRLREALERHGVRCRLTPACAEAIGAPELAGSFDEIADQELVFILGGDGSVLLTARHAAPKGTPMLPLEVGGFGFLYETPATGIEEQLGRVVAGDYEIEERLLLEAAVLRRGARIKEAIGLNDAVIAKGALSRVVRLKVNVGDEEVSHYPADGLIVSTPTGATAYSLSAGGPLVHPGVNVFLLTPICAHTLFARPLIIGSHEDIRIDIGLDSSRDEEAMLTVDGQIGFALEDGDVVCVKAAPYRAKLVKLGPAGFYSRLKTKFQWGGGL